MSVRWRVVLYCAIGGLPLLLASSSNGAAAWFWLAGMVLAASLVPIALFGPRRAPGQLGVILPIFLIVTVFCTWTEGLIFLPLPEVRGNALRNLLGAMATYTVVAATLALLAHVLNLSREGGPPPQVKAPVRVALATAGAGFVYVLFYLVVGAFVYQFFTKQYFPRAEQDVARIGAWFWVVQLARGVLMTLAVLPAIYTLRMTRARAALTFGLIIWVAGGAAPLLMPNSFMGTTQRFIHIAEIFGQNLPLGVVAVLFVRKRVAEKSPTRARFPAGQAFTS